MKDHLIGADKKILTDSISRDVETVVRLGIKLPFGDMA